MCDEFHTLGALGGDQGRVVAKSIEGSRRFHLGGNGHIGGGLQGSDVTARVGLGYGQGQALYGVKGIQGIESDVNIQSITPLLLYCAQRLCSSLIIESCLMT